MLSMFATLAPFVLRCVRFLFGRPQECKVRTYELLKMGAEVEGSPAAAALDWHILQCRKVECGLSSVGMTQACGQALGSGSRSGSRSGSE